MWGANPLYAAPTAKEIAERDFTLKVLPLFKAKCFACHGDDAKKIKGDLNMLTREGLLKGGEGSDKVLIPGNAQASQLFVAVTWENSDLEMPPKENDRLNKEQIEFVRAWIEAGAPWPDESIQKKHRESEWSVAANADGIIIKSSGGLADEWTYRRYKPEDVWAFQPLKKPAVPMVNGTPAKRPSPIDAFIAEKLQKKSFDPAPPADALTLIRRATFDLTGLPPSPDEIKVFLAEWKTNAEQAWSRLIDRLLASPSYGERWGQHWLDVARYADTGGYSNDYERSNAWRYRDYVIRSFNQDKPYDQFIMEQLAGDELWEQQKPTERNPELLVATGFLRMGPWDPAMVKNEEARQIFLDDVVNSVGQTFLSTTMRCFKCHDHKFDPLPTRDYYRFYSAFSGTQMAERPAPFLLEENQDGFTEGKELVKRLLAFATEKKDGLEEKKETAARQWFKEHGLEYVSEKDRKDLPDEMKPPRHVGLDFMEQGRLKVREQDEWIWTRRQERYEPLAQSVYNGPDPKFLNARKLRMPDKVNESWKPDSRILTGGSLEAPGEKVSPGVLSALGIPVRLNADDPYVISDDLAGRRLALATWIADARNPLTSRSIVNRVWQHHFGKPLAGNPNNFGVKGAKPTHPELLDWLAVNFLEQGRTLKHLHKLIMTSETYRQSARHPQMEKLQTIDPNNDLFAFHPSRRLTAEELRDGMLAITGELNPEMGGVPIMPEMNMEVALQPRMIQFSIAPAYQPSPTPRERNRRSIYAYRVRGQADPFMEVFNQPNPNESCDLRDAASVSPQAFTMMNSDVMSDRAIAFALRLQQESKTLKGQVQRAFLIALGRVPSASEQKRLETYVRQMQEYHRGTQAEPVKYPTRITRSLVEEFTGQPFEYDEILPAFEKYVADKKAADVGTDTRALADLCLLMFNSNEFIYIY